MISMSKKPTALPKPPYASQNRQCRKQCRTIKPQRFKRSLSTIRSHLMVNRRRFLKISRVRAKKNRSWLNRNPANFRQLLIYKEDLITQKEMEEPYPRIRALL